MHSGRTVVAEVSSLRSDYTRLLVFPSHIIQSCHGSLFASTFANSRTPRNVNPVVANPVHGSPCIPLQLRDL